MKHVLDPPGLDEDEFSKSLEILDGYIKSNELQLGEKYLSQIVQNQIENIQKKSCDGPNLLCGHEHCAA